MRSTSILFVVTLLFFFFGASSVLAQGGELVSPEEPPFIPPPLNEIPSGPLLPSGPILTIPFPPLPLCHGICPLCIKGTHCACIGGTWHCVPDPIPPEPKCACHLFRPCPSFECPLIVECITDWNKCPPKKCFKPIPIPFPLPIPDLPITHPTLPPPPPPPTVPGPTTLKAAATSIALSPAISDSLTAALFPPWKCGPIGCKPGYKCDCVGGYERCVPICKCYIHPPPIHCPVCIKAPCIPCLPIPPPPPICITDASKCPTGARRRLLQMKESKPDQE